jgi:DNA-binding NtrC family response regulator
VERGARPLTGEPEHDPERTRILGAIDECGGNQTMAANKLGISRRTLVARLHAWGLTRPRRRR